MGSQRVGHDWGTFTSLHFTSVYIKGSEQNLTSNPCPIRVHYYYLWREPVVSLTDRPSDYNSSRRILSDKHQSGSLCPVSALYPTYTLNNQVSKTWGHFFYKLHIMWIAPCFSRTEKVLVVNKAENFKTFLKLKGMCHLLLLLWVYFYTSHLIWELKKSRLNTHVESCVPCCCFRSHQ